MHPDFLRSIKVAKKKRIHVDDAYFEGDEPLNEDDSNGLRFVYPYGQSLDVDLNVSVVFNSGIIAYPANRALSACCATKNKKGKLFVLGSERFFEDEFFEKEENKKITVNIYS